MKKRQASRAANDRNHQSCRLSLRSAPRFCVWMQCVVLVVLRIVEQDGNSPRKGEDPGLHFSRSLLRSLCFDFKGPAMSKLRCAATRKQHACHDSHRIISAGYANSTGIREALSASRKYRPWITPKFLLHWYWRNAGPACSSEVPLQAGDIPTAHRGG